MSIFASLPFLSLKRTDRIIVMICLAISLVFLLIVTKPSDVEFRRDLRQIARLSEDSDQIKRKFYGNISWNEISDGAVLFQNDEVFTGANSFAKILFLKSKANIKLPPQSLIRLEELNGEIALDMKEGVVELETAFQGKVKIIKNGKTFTISSKNKSQVLLSSVDGELLITSSSPGVTVSSDSKTRLLVDGEVVNVNEKLESSKANIPKPIEKNKLSKKISTTNSQETVKKISATEDKINKEKAIEREKKLKYTSYLKIYVISYIIFCIVLSILPEAK